MPSVSVLDFNAKGNLFSWFRDFPYQYRKRTLSAKMKCEKIFYQQVATKDKISNVSSVHVLLAASTSDFRVS